MICSSVFFFRLSVRVVGDVTAFYTTIFARWSGGYWGQIQFSMGVGQGARDLNQWPFGH